MILADSILDVYFQQHNCKHNRICGDVFSLHRGEDHCRVILCDGMGHGIKANVLANITAAVVARFDFGREQLSSLVNQLAKSWPVCSVRKMSHSTFTVVEIDAQHRRIRFVNYGNPEPILFAEKGRVELQWTRQSVEEFGQRPRNVYFAEIGFPEKEAAVMLFTDGVTQSGVGKAFPFGWGKDRCTAFVEGLVQAGLSVCDIVRRVIEQSIKNEQNSDETTSDDVSCGVITLKPKA